MARWATGERTVAFLVERGRLEAIEAIDPVAAASTAVERAERRLLTQAEYFDRSAPPLAVADAEWPFEKSRGAVAGVRELLAVDPPDRFVVD